MYIAYITSDEYAPYAGISLTSIFENNKNVEYIKVFICCYDLSEKNKSKFIETSIRYEREIEFIYIKVLKIKIQKEKICKNIYQMDDN